MMNVLIKEFTVVGLWISLIMGSSSTWAIGEPDKVDDFVNPPRLLGVATSQNGTYLWGATYYFTVAIPQNAGKPLQKLEIQLEGSVARPFFNASQTEAFEGTRSAPGARVSLQDVAIAGSSRTLTVTFAPPVSPGKTVTLRIYPVRNPNTGGTYLYGVTAFPPGEHAVGQFLGFGRIRIYDRNTD